MKVKIKSKTLAIVAMTIMCINLIGCERYNSFYDNASNDKTSESVTASEEASEDNTGDPIKITKDPILYTLEESDPDMEEIEFEAKSDKVGYFMIPDPGKGKVKADLDCDGNTEAIEYDLKADNNNYAEKLTLTINGKEYDVPEIGSYSAYCRMELFWLNTGESLYMYLQCMTDNDWTILGVYKVEDNTIRYVGEEGLDVSFTIQDDNGSNTEMYITDPEDFLVKGYVSMFGTWNYTERYRVGQDGMPESINGYRYLTSNNSYEITAKKDIPCVVCQDEAATSGENSTIPSGMKVTPIGCDGKTFVDLKLDGKDGIYRINVHEKDEYQWGLTDLGGKSVEDCFDGLPFWG